VPSREHDDSTEVPPLLLELSLVTVAVTEATSEQEPEREPEREPEPEPEPEAEPEAGAGGTCADSASGVLMDQGEGVRPTGTTEWLGLLGPRAPIASSEARQNTPLLSTPSASEEEDKDEDEDEDEHEEDEDEVLGGSSTSTTLWSTWRSCCMPRLKEMHLQKAVSRATSSATGMPAICAHLALLRCGASSIVLYAR